MIDSVILAGGLGTRLRTSVPDAPKPLAPIHGVPFLHILLNQLSAFPLSKIVLALGYKAELIQTYCQKTPFRDLIAFSVEHEPLGTGGALKKALSMTRSEQILVLNGDSFLDIPFPSFWEKHGKTGADLTLACVKRKNPGRYGALSVEEGSGKIFSFTEPSPWINGGVYLMRREALAELALGAAFSLEKEAFPALLHKALYAFPCSGPFIDIGTPQSYEKAQELFRAFERIALQPFPNKDRAGIEFSRPHYE